MQAGEDFILAPTDKRLHLLQTKFVNPLAVGQHVPHGTIKHGHRHWGVFHKDSEHHFHVFGFGVRRFVHGGRTKGGRSYPGTMQAWLNVHFLQRRYLRLGLNDVFEH